MPHLYRFTPSHQKLGFFPKRCFIRNNSTIHNNSTPLSRNRDSQSMILPDRRALGFAEYGHPEGHALFHFHGTRGSRRSAAIFDEPVKTLGLRIIGVDWPGIGLSSFQPGHQILDWPRDILHLTHHLELNYDSVLGTTEGGPYALARAKLLSPEKSEKVGMSKTAPWTTKERGVWERYGRFLQICT